MNIAASALAVFLLVLPGILFRRCFLRGLRGLPVRPRDLTDEIAVSAVAAAPLQGVWGWLVHVLYLTRFSELRIDLHACARVVLGQYGDKNELLDRTIGSIADNPCAVIVYFAGLYAVSIGSGFAAHSLVSRLGFVRNGGFFGFNSHWHQVFSGELYDGARQKDANFCVVSALVELGSETYLYRGLLRGPEDVVFDANGEIDLLLLAGTERRKIANDNHGAADESASVQSRFYPINGDLFVLRYAHTKTINLNYGLVSKMGSGSPPPPADSTASE